MGFDKTCAATGCGLSFQGFAQMCVLATGRIISVIANGRRKLTAHPYNLCCKAITSHERKNVSLKHECSQTNDNIFKFSVYKLQTKSTRFAWELLSAAAISACIIYQLKLQTTSNFPALHDSYLDSSWGWLVSFACPYFLLSSSRFISFIKSCPGSGASECVVLSACLRMNGDEVTAGDSDLDGTPGRGDEPRCGVMSAAEVGPWGQSWRRKRAPSSFTK